jgi:CRISPR system Cascade subunit CasD
MPTFLILKLNGVMQAWGEHSYEDYRPSHIFPTRSGVVGLLAACLGLDRQDWAAQAALNASFTLTVRADDVSYPMQKIIDYHTITDARRVNDQPRDNAIISQREYLCDAQFTVVLQFKPNAAFQQAQIITAVQRPVYSPFLGRRSCPLGRPLYEQTLETRSVEDVLQQIAPHKGTVYSEHPLDHALTLHIRDNPMPKQNRQFATRTVYFRT